MGHDIENKIMEVFYEFPEKSFTVRELSSLTKIPRATLHKKVILLKNRGVITKDNHAKDTLLFKTKKINYFIEKIVASGLVEKIIEDLNPSCIILFGSIRKGDSIKESDIDLFVESPKKEDMNFSIFEKRLGHPIQLFVESNINDLNQELLNNVVNGIKLFGSFKIK